MHLEPGSVQRAKKAPTYKGCGKPQKRPRSVEICAVMWKSVLFSGKLALLTRRLRPIRDVNRICVHCLVMASPSPLDLCWKVKDAPGSSPILPAVRAAVEEHWPETLRNAASVLRDEALAAEIMEAAIEKSVAYLVDRPPEDHEDVSVILSRFCREEIGRRRKESNRLVFIDSSVIADTASSHSQIPAAEAAIDAERILVDAPPRVREAMMMRYGGSESWNDVAARTATTANAIRKECKRYLDRIRQKLGILGAPQ
jgi:DNA-directed RNA polymerase specialized sigma24 family protein